MINPGITSFLMIFSQMAIASENVQKCTAHFSLTAPNGKAIATSSVLENVMNAFKKAGFILQRKDLPSEYEVNVSTNMQDTGMASRAAGPIYIAHAKLSIISNTSRNSIFDIHTTDEDNFMFKANLHTAVNKAIRSLPKCEAIGY